MFLSDFLQLPKTGKQHFLDASHILPFLRQLPVEFSPVDISGIIPSGRVFMVSIVIFLSDLVPAVNNGNPRLGKHIGMKHKIQRHSQGQCFLILFESPLLHTAQRCRRTAQPCISRSRVGIIQFPPCSGARKLPGEIVVQILLMAHFSDTELHEPAIIQSPSDIIMTAQIIQKQIFFWQTVHNVHLKPQKSCIFCCHRMPCGSHCRHIVEHMAFRFLHRTEIGHYLLRLHHHFTQK